MDSKPGMRPRWSLLAYRPALTIPLGYWLLGSIYILLSDYITEHALGTGFNALLVHVSKGLIFIAVTALLLFLILKRVFRIQAETLARLQGVLDTAEDAVVITDGHSAILSFSSGAEAITGYHAAEVLGRNFKQLIPPAAWASFDNNISEMVAAGGPQRRTRQEYTAVRKGGAVYPVSSAVTCRPFGNHILILHVFQDISGQRADDQRKAMQLLHQRQLVALSARLLEAHTEDEACNVVCDQITTELGYPLAWVAAPFAGDAEIYPVSKSGPAAAFVDGLQVRNDDSRLGTGPTGRALRDRQLVVTNDLAADPSYAPWLDQARACSLAAKLSVPVILPDSDARVLSVYSSQQGAFGEDVQVLFQTIANMLSDAIQRGQAAAREAREAQALAERNIVLEQQQAQLRREFTERLEAEEGLRQEEEKYKHLLDEIGIPIAMAQDERIKYVNRAFASLVQYAPLELIGKPIDTVIPSRLRGAVREMQAAHQAGNMAPADYRSALLRQDGQEVEVDRKLVMVDFLGRPAGLIADIDITAQLAAEGALQASEAKFRAVFEHSPWPIAIGRMSDGCQVEVNPKMAEFFGYAREEMVGRTSLELGLWADLAERNRVLDLLNQSGAISEFETTLVSRTRGQRQVIMASAQVELGGQPHYVSMLYDITTQLQTEQELAHVLEATGATQWTWDLASGAMTDLGGMYQALGYPPSVEPLTADRWFELFHPEDLPRVQAIIAAALSSGSDRAAASYRFRAGDGSYRWLHSVATITARDAAGKPLRLQGITVDITDFRP